MKCTKPCFEMKNNENITEKDSEFLKELYHLMQKYHVHRIYSASLDAKKIITAEQLLCSTIGNSKISNKIFDFVDKHMPRVYSNIFYRNHIFRYKLRLKRLFNKYNLEKISISAFNLYQGIHTTANSLCVREVDLIYKDERICHIDNLYLDRID